MKRLLGTVVSLVVVLGNARAADWPQFRGPKRDGISPETNLLKSWPEGGPRVLWTNDRIGHGWSSVAVVKDSVYTTGNVGKYLTVTALDSGGKVRWQQTLVNGKVYGRGHRSRRLTALDLKTGRQLYNIRSLGKSSIICADGRIYAQGHNGGVVRLIDPTNGKVISSFGMQNRRRVWAMPAISDGRLYIRNASQLTCFDIRAGN